MESISVKRPTTTPSNLRRRFLCPGSAQLEARQPEDQSRDAQKGKLLHGYWANPDFDRSFLSPADRDLLELSDRLCDDVLNRLAFEVIHEPPTHARPNQRLHDDSHLQPMYHVEHAMHDREHRLPGKPDRIYVWPLRKAALVVDLKTGWAIVESADLNLQLRGYALNVADSFDVDEVFVAILQPRLWSPAERITLARYEKADIEKARGQIYAIIDASERKGAPLRAGEEQCRYCKAKLNCKAFRQAVALPVASFKSELDLTKAAREAFVAERIKQCSDEQLEQVLEACALAKQVSEPAHIEARTRIRDGRFNRFILGKEFEVRTVTNVRRAIAMLALSGVATREDILDVCEFSIRTIEEKFRDKHRGMTWQQARDKINKVLASVIAREPREPKIIKRKK